MLKKFVPLNCNASPSKNPYEVRTYMGEPSGAPDWKAELCEPDRKCGFPANSTISKVLTIEDEIRRLNQKAKESKFQRMVKKKCTKSDYFTACTQTRRNIEDLRENSVMREGFLKIAFDVSRRVHDGSILPAPGPSRIELNSPGMSEGEEEDKSAEDEGEEEEDEGPVKPKFASPSCSMDVIYMPPKRILELKRPKSGMFHNQSEPPIFIEDVDIPYSTYNPRVLQEKFDGQCLETIDIIEGKDPNDLWTWNIGLQQRESDLDRAFIKAKLDNIDCSNMELTLFKIPKDLDKTFAAEIVFGNEAVLPDRTNRKRPPFYNRPKEIACIFYAFVETFRLNPDFWTGETMDAILASAAKILKKSTVLNFKSQDTDFDILCTIADKQAEIGLKVHFTGLLENEPNIYKTLSLYFSKFSAALLVARGLYLLIWKRCRNYFYVFDPNGRNELCQRDFENGKCSLMATRHVEHLVHLIVNFSEADMNGEFHLYEIFITSYGKILHPVPTKPLPKPMRKLWAVVNGAYALIPGANYGLQQPITGNEHNPSMIISLLSLLYSNIERASLWRMEMVDDLIKFGQAYYKSLLKKMKLKKKQHFNIADLPEFVVLGVFRATLQKFPFLYTGHVVDCKTFFDSQLTVAVKELFSAKWEAALLQIDNSIMALWRDMEYFYVFDPFRRGKAGQVLDPEDYLTKGVACLQMHTNFESFCRILYQKAVKMRRGGKYFLHGVNIGCIRPMTAAISHKMKFTRLNLTYPRYSDAPSQVDDKKKSKKKDKKKKKKLERTYSIQSIPEEDRIAEFEDSDVVETTLEEILCQIFEQLAEPIPDRAQLYRQAEKILLRSDQDYLKTLKYQLRHGEDYDNIFEAFQTQPEQPPKPLTLEEELQVRSNFEVLPDGTWVIFGTSYLPAADDDTMKLGGLLATIVTAALSMKYKISTWNSELIEYALAATMNFGEEFNNYEYTLTVFLAKKLPKICIGQSTYYIKAEKVIKASMTRPLRQILLEALINHNRLMVICQRFSCLIVKRYNFLYMFIGFPCNSVGYRKFGSGPGCMLRFVELDALIRRIEFGCNPQGCEITNYVAVAVKILDLTNVPPGRFRKWADSDEENMYANELERKQRTEKNKMDKMRFLDKELRKENERIQRFLAEKQERIDSRKYTHKKHRKSPMISRKSQATEDYDDWEYEFEDEMEDEFEEEEVELKHKPGKKLKRELVAPFKPRPILYGYRMRVKDCMFKIQGSIALEGRAESAIDKIKPCFFVSALALLYAILRPLNEWSSQRVDRVLESGKMIASRVSNMTSAFERLIKNVTIDEYKFDVWVKTFDPAGVWGSSVHHKIAKATQTRRYLLLQISNCTFAIFRDEYLHLFDPYATMEKLGEGEEEEAAEESYKKKRCPRGIKRFGERNTASWILFADVDEMVKYIDERAANPAWKESNEYAFHAVDVLSYKKAGPRTQILQLLTDLSTPITCETSQHGEDETVICAHNENINWLDLENCLPVWSRMNRRNTAGRYRNLPVSKLKKYDVEIAGRLWSLWGNLHPQAPVFESVSRGKQFLACNVMACCAAKVYRITDWSAHLLDTVVINGDRYHRESLDAIKQQDYEFSMEDLNLECTLENIKFVVHLEHVAYGKLYATPTRTLMNLAEALMYFFSHFQFGVLQCLKRSLAIGRTMGHDGGYFMYDCQSRDHPLFPKGQGASYLLRTKHLQVLLYCIVVTLNVPYYNMQFTLHKVELFREGASVEDEGGDEEEGN